MPDEGEAEGGDGGDSSASGDYPPLDRIVLAAARRYASLSAPLVYLRESGGNLETEEIKQRRDGVA